MMKKLLAIAVSLILVLGVCGCGGASANETAVTVGEDVIELIETGDYGLDFENQIRAERDYLEEHGNVKKDKAADWEDLNADTQLYFTLMSLETPKELTEQEQSYFIEEINKIIR